MGNRRITMRRLGTMGRFGNQLFQYTFLRCYQKRHGVDIEIPWWIGRYLFGHEDSYITHQFPAFAEKFEHGIDDTRIPNLEEPLDRVDVRGYFHYHTSYYAPDRQSIQRWFYPLPWIDDIASQAVTKLRSRGRRVVALHLRRGDYGFGHCFRAPSSWYRPWLAKWKQKWPDAVVYIASDEPATVCLELAEFSPVRLADLTRQPLPFPDFYLDFYVLCHADAVAISNSSFSFFACMLNQRSVQFDRPVLQEEALVPFDPWDAMPVLMDAKVASFPHHVGIRRAT